MNKVAVEKGEEETEIGGVTAPMGPLDTTLGGTSL